MSTNRFSPKAILGVSAFPKSYRTLMLVSLLYILSNNLSSVFVSTYFFKQTNNNTIVILYYIVMYIFECLTFFVVARLNKQQTVTKSLRIGLLIIFLSYILLLVLRESAAKYFYFIAMLYGISVGFYGLSFAELSIALTEPSYRQKAIAVTATIASTMLIVAPLLSGALLTYLPGMAGYFVLFGLTSVGLALSALLSARLPDVSASVKPAIFRSLKVLVRDKVAQSFLTGEVLRGLRDGTLLFYLNILLFTFVRNAGGDGNTGETMLSLNLSLKGVMTVLTYFFISKCVTDAMRRKIVILATLTNLGLTLLLGILMNTTTVFIYCILDSVMYTFYFNSTQYVAFDVVEYVSRTENRRSETLAARSFCVDIGRIIGLLCVLAVPSDVKYVIPVLCALYCADILSYLCYRRAWKNMQDDGTVEKGNLL